MEVQELKSRCGEQSSVGGSLSTSVLSDMVIWSC